MTLDGYIVIPRWDEFTHRDAIRTGPPMKWHKNLVEQLDNDAYRELSLGDRGLLHDVRLLVARTGNGRVSARQAHLRGNLGTADKYLERRLERLIQAGFLELSASRLPAQCQQPASTEERRGEGLAPTALSPSTTKRARDAAGSAAARAPATPNGDQPEPDEPDLTDLIADDRQWVIGRIAQGIWTRSRFAGADDETWHDLERDAEQWRAEHPPLTATRTEPDDADEESI